MIEKNRLKVIVNSELTLDAGWWEEVEIDGEVYRIVHPPEQTLFFQILDYLAHQPPSRVGYLSNRDQATAAATVCLRWGSYLAVLTDRNKPLDPQVKSSDYEFISHISDGEMARINIEASAALAHWIDIRRQDYDHYLSLVSYALNLLPITSRTIKGWPDKVYFWAVVEAFAKMPDEIWAGYEREIAEVEAYPTRVFANALINYSWRNGSGVEDIHAGRRGNYSLSHRRIRPSEERKLFNATALRMREGFATLDKLDDTPGEWRQKVLPYHLASSFLITPTNWALAAETHEFRLPGDTYSTA